MRRISKIKRRLIEDVLFVSCGVILSIILVQAGILEHVLGFLGTGPLSSLIAGLFFTSAFTIAPASVALASIAFVSPVKDVALFGALGAMIGDFAIFLFIRDRFGKDVIAFIKSSQLRIVLRSFHFGFLKWLSPLFGALIIASPLPDELGLALLGLSRTRLILLLPISFIMNFIGIYGIAYLPHII